MMKGSNDQESKDDKDEKDENPPPPYSQSTTYRVEDYPSVPSDASRGRAISHGSTSRGNGNSTYTTERAVQTFTPYRGSREMRRRSGSVSSVSSVSSASSSSSDSSSSSCSTVRVSLLFPCRRTKLYSLLLFHTLPGLSNYRVSHTESLTSSSHRVSEKIIHPCSLPRPRTAKD